MKVIVHLDTFVHEIDLGVRQRPAAMEQAEHIVKNGLWIDNHTLIPPHRINLIEVKR